VARGKSKNVLISTFLVARTSFRRPFLLTGSWTDLSAVGRTSRNPKSVVDLHREDAPAPAEQTVRSDPDALIAPAADTRPMKRQQPERDFDPVR
jgi:hypothetical protein